MNESNYKFLSLLSTKLDSAQSEALETTDNAVIAAGAGSGKTQVLATRFAWLVMTGKAKADEILTLTFTNKAAAEMYKRIYDTLKFFAEHEPCPELTAAQIQLAKNGLEDFANAHIQTLDSYCANIVRQCSNRYGIRPDFSTGSTDGLRDVKDRAFKFTLKNATNPGIATFADAGQLQNFAEKTIAQAINEYTNLTTPKDFFSSFIPAQKEKICQALNFYFANTQKTDDNFPGGYNLRKIHEDILAEFAVDKKAKDHFAYKTAFDEIFEIADSFLGYNFKPDEFSSTSKELKNITDSFQQFANGIKKVTGFSGKLTSANKLIIQIRDTLNPVIESLLSYITQYEALVSFYSLLDNLLAEVNSAKRNSGNLSFGDVSELALQILIENEDIREQEISAYKKIMIDEFQDNNGKNRDLLYLLSLKPGTKITLPAAGENNISIHNQIIIKDKENNIIEDKRTPDKLFFVGDEKQSIYKFRGADVSVFNELTQCGENKLVPMTFNYRSDDSTVKAFNQIFANGKGIFSENSIRLDYEAYYDKEALKNGKVLPELTQENIPFHFRFVNKSKLKKVNETILDSNEKLIPEEDQLAFDIATKIYNQGKDNKNWNDFAILAKGRTHQNIITKYLSRYNIPYEVDAFKNIFEDGVINDIYNFLRLCVYPSDINAYGAYLCSPLAGVSENSLEIILSHLVDTDDYNFVFNPFISKSTDLEKDLSAQEYKKYIEANKFLANLRSDVLQQKITTTLDILWNKTGYKYETLLSPQTELAAEHFDMIFELARTCESEGKTVSWFIDELENLKKSMSAEDSDIDTSSISYPLERSEAVKIMTIHKSKGLQFKHVFLCDCTDVHIKSENSSIFFDSQTGLSIKPEKGSGNYFCICQKELEKKKELAEFRRLIYVGITRAISHVYVMGKWLPQGDSYDTKSDFHIFERLAEKTYGMSEEEVVTYKTGAAFDFVNIPLVNYAAANTSKDVLLDDIRSEKIKTLKPEYENVQEIQYTSNAIPRSCPSALETDYTPDSTSEDALKDDIRQENQEEGHLRQEGFTAADFGTLVHAYLEAQANGIEPEQFQPAPKLFKNLEDDKKSEVISQCINYCKVFCQTEAGKNFIDAKQNSRFYRAEWAFKMFWNKTIWTGSIDLIYENPDGTYTIIDYKSDNTPDSEKYAGQQNCYRTAAAKMLKVDENKIECKLWFMKDNKLISLKPSDHQ